MIRVVIADDHPVVRAGLRALLELDSEIEVVAEAASADEAVRAAQAERPDLVLMDLRFGAKSDENGASATRRIRALANAPHVLVVTNYDSDGDILGAVEAGASGYLLKDAPPAELLAAVRAAASGASALAPPLAARRMARLRAPPSAARLMDRLRSPQQSLSAREIQVLALVADGLANADVAARLHVTETTVKSHLAHVFTKLGVTSRTAAVSEARARGVLR